MEKTEGRYEAPECPSASGSPLLTIGELWIAINALVPAGLGNRRLRPGPGDPEAPSDTPADHPSAAPCPTPQETVKPCGRNPSCCP